MSGTIFGMTPTEITAVRIHQQLLALWPEQRNLRLVVAILATRGMLGRVGEDTGIGFADLEPLMQDQPDARAETIAARDFLNVLRRGLDAQIRKLEKGNGVVERVLAAILRRTAVPEYNLLFRKTMRNSLAEIWNPASQAG